jgi:hypothetical protein
LVSESVRLSQRFSRSFDGHFNDEYRALKN